MTNTAISAGATALPRRTILTGLMATAAAMVVTMPATRAFGTTAAGTDPIFAAIEHHAVASKAYADLLDADEDHPSLEVVGNAEFAAWDAFVATPFISMDGAIAFVEHFARYFYLSGGRDSEDPEDVLERFAASLRQISGAGVASTPPRATQPAKPDPVLPAIEAFKTATAAAVNSPDWSDAVMEPLWSERKNALIALAKTKPTTRHGAHAMMHEILDGEHSDCLVEVDSSVLKVAIATLLAAWPNPAVQS